jgi:hypothetical protein
VVKVYVLCLGDSDVEECIDGIPETLVALKLRKLHLRYPLQPILMAMNLYSALMSAKTNV